MLAEIEVAHLVRGRTYP